MELQVVTSLNCLIIQERTWPPPSLLAFGWGDHGENLNLHVDWDYSS